MRGALAIREPDKIALPRCQVRHRAIEVAALLRLYCEVTGRRRLASAILGERSVVEPRPPKSIVNQVGRDPKQVVPPVIITLERDARAKQPVVAFLKEIV